MATTELAVVQVHLVELLGVLAATKGSKYVFSPSAGQSVVIV
jgi:hypothetical protein